MTNMSNSTLLPNLVHCDKMKHILLQLRCFWSMEEVRCPVQYPLPPCNLDPRWVQEGWRGQVWVERSLCGSVKQLWAQAVLPCLWKVCLKSQHLLSFAAPCKEVQQFIILTYNSPYYSFLYLLYHTHLFWISSALFFLA